MKKKTLLAAMSLLAPLASISSNVNAQELEITVTNLTQGIYFTPLVVAAHDADTHMYMTGEYATAELQAIAEGGDISGMVTLLSNADADISENPAMGLLAPTMSTTFMLTNAADNDYLSVTTMLLPTNDGFVGLDSWMIPETAGTYTIYLNAYDAGTEANNELVVEGSGAPGVLGIPAAPGGHAGMNGTGVTDMEDNKMIHIHRGTLGDDMMMGGKSDLNNTVHRWLNPVAKVTVKVM